MRDVGRAKTDIREMVGSSVEDGCDKWRENMNMLGKDLEKARQRNEVSSCLKKMASFYFFYFQHEWFLKKRA